VYLPYQMQRNLAPREMTANQQREADEQLGQLAAAVTRWGHRVAARVHAAAALGKPQPRCDLMGGSPRPGMRRT
jgi:hypothetical protein